MDYQDPIHDKELSASFTDSPTTHLPLGCLAIAVTLFTGFVSLGCLVHPDTPEQLEAVKQAETQAVICGVAAIALWGILITRGILGNGKEQAATLKNAAQVIIPSRPKIPSESKDILVRASNETPSNETELLRPVKDDPDVAPNELLRASDSK